MILVGYHTTCFTSYTTNLPIGLLQANMLQPINQKCWNQKSQNIEIYLYFMMTRVSVIYLKEVFYKISMQEDPRGLYFQLEVFGNMKIFHTILSHQRQTYSTYSYLWMLSNSSIQKQLHPLYGLLLWREKLRK